MRKVITCLFIALGAGALAIVCAYMQRGHWAVGSELVVPVLVAAALLYMKGDQNERD